VKRQKRDPEYFELTKIIRGTIASLHSAYGVRFLHLFRTVVQDDRLILRFTPTLALPPPIEGEGN